MLKLPSKFLLQHGSKIRDGLAVLKLVALTRTRTPTRTPTLTQL